MRLVFVQLHRFPPDPGNRLFAVLCDYGTALAIAQTSISRAPA